MTFSYCQKALAFCIASIVTVSVHAQTTMEEFYTDTDRKAKFEQAVEAGFLDQARQRMVTQCTAQGAAAQLDCECFETQLSDLSDEVLFYESTIAYENYQAIVAAMDEGDMERANELKGIRDSRTSQTAEVQQQCTVE